MMKQVNVHEAKTHLSRLLENVEAGEEVIICRAGKPVAKLIPFRAKHEPRKPGSLRGQIWIADDFDDELSPEIQAAFNGELD